MVVPTHAAHACGSRFIRLRLRVASHRYCSRVPYTNKQYNCLLSTVLRLSIYPNGCRTFGFCSVIWTSHALTALGRASQSAKSRVRTEGHVTLRYTYLYRMLRAYNNTTPGTATNDTAVSSKAVRPQSSDGHTDRHTTSALRGCLT